MALALTEEIVEATEETVEGMEETVVDMGTAEVAMETEEATGEVTMIVVAVGDTVLPEEADMNLVALLVEEEDTDWSSMVFQMASAGRFVLPTYFRSLCLLLGTFCVVRFFSKDGIPSYRSSSQLPFLSPFLLVVCLSIVVA